MQLTFVLVICSVLFFQNCSDEKQTVAEYKSRPSVSTARSNRVLPDTANAVYKFLKYHFPVVYQVETGTEVFFRDEFLEIPDSLQVKLKNFFPDFEFKIAKMAFMHWGPEDVNLALILERDFFNQRVYHINSYAWSIWFNGDLPFSFRNLLNHHSLVSLNKKVDFYQHVDALAKLLAFASNLKFFKTYKTGGDIIAEFESIVFGTVLGKSELELICRLKQGITNRQALVFFDFQIAWYRFADRCDKILGTFKSGTFCGLALALFFARLL